MAPNQPARAYSQKDLPPSVETAYYRKCIDLRRRINDIEESNDSTRLRITRLSRGVTKMRLERAFLLEQLNKHMEFNLDDSDRSSSPPPTPTDKPLRSKRSHRKGTPPAGDSAQGGAVSVSGGVAHQSPTSVHQSILHPVHPLSSAQSTPDPGRVSSSYFSTIGANAGPGSPAGANGAPTLPPLSSLQQSLGQAPRSEGASRPYFDPAYDEQRPAENDADAQGRRRAYSGAQAAGPPPATNETVPPQNGDTEMTDANFPPANR